MTVTFRDAGDTEPEVAQHEDLDIARALQFTCSFIWGKLLNLSEPLFLEDEDDDSAHVRAICENY